MAKDWIKKAVNPAHKGYCTPMTKATCTPKRKAFAKTMKKHHGFHKKEEGGMVLKAQDGQAVYVSDPNDPRLKNYSDSLYNYGIGQRLKGVMTADKDYFATPDRSPLQQQLNNALPFLNKGLADNSFAAGKPEVRQLMQWYKQNGNKAIMPIRYQHYHNMPSVNNAAIDLVTLRGVRELAGLTKPRDGNYNLPEWKKPEQKVIYKPKPNQVVFPTKRSYAPKALPKPKPAFTPQRTPYNPELIQPTVPAQKAVVPGYNNTMPAAPQGDYRVEYYNEQNQPVHKYFQTEQEGSKFQRSIGGERKGYWDRKMQKGGMVPKAQNSLVVTPDDETKRKRAAQVVEIAKRRIKNKEWIEVPEDIANASYAAGHLAGSCIGGVCSVLKEAGVMPDIIWSNTEFSKKAKELGFPNKGYGVKGIENLEPGDVMQHNVNTNKQNNYYPGHAQIFMGKNEKSGEYEFFDNYNKVLKTYKPDELSGWLDPKRKRTERSASIYKLNPYTAPESKPYSPEALADIEMRQRMNEYNKSHFSNYRYAIRKDAKDYNEDTKAGMDAFVKFANDDKNINMIAEKTGRSTDEVHDSLLNVFGELGQENQWQSPVFSGTLGMEGIGERVLKNTKRGKGISVGPGQIKFKWIPDDLKEKFGIDKPADLYDTSKVIPLMTAMDLRNKQTLTHWGQENTLSDKLIGITDQENPLKATDLKGGVGRWSPYLVNQFSNIRFKKRTVPGVLPFTTNVVPNTVPNKNGLVSPYVLDEGSYPDKVYHATDDNLERTLYQDEGEENQKILPEVVVKTKVEKKGKGGAVGCGCEHAYLNALRTGQKLQHGGLVVPKAQNSYFNGMPGPTRAVSDNTYRQPLKDQYPADIEAWRRQGAAKAYQQAVAKQPQVRGITKKQYEDSKHAGMGEILQNPVTALTNVMHNRPNVQGFSNERNIYDHAIDVVNPYTYAKAVYNTAGNIVHPINTAQTLGKGVMNLATNLVDDQNFYNDDTNEKALGIVGDAAMAFGARGLAKNTLGVVDRQFSKVGQQLERIRLEGQAAGLDAHQIAKNQMEQVGITSNQRKAYTPVLSNFAEKYIRPYGYEGSSNTKLEQTLQNIKKGGWGREEMDASRRIDAWNLYLGKPQINNAFSIAETAPVNHPSYTSKQLKGMDIYSINDDDIINTIKPQYSFAGNAKRTPDNITTDLNLLQKPLVVDKEMEIMGGYNKRLTDYGFQYNDIWDLHPSVVPSRVADRILPPNLRNNKWVEKALYKNVERYDDFSKTKVISQLPRSFKLKAEKVLGKPFMSHGNFEEVTREDIISNMRKSLQLGLQQPDAPFTYYNRMNKYIKVLDDVSDKKKDGGMVMNPLRTGQKLQHGGLVVPKAQNSFFAGMPGPTRAVADSTRVKKRDLDLEAKTRQKMLNADYQMLINAGVDKESAVKQLTTRGKRAATTTAVINNQKQVERIIRNSQGYDPSKPVMQQLNLAQGNDLTQNLIRGANMAMSEDLGNPVMNYAKDVMVTPGKAALNLTVDPYNQYVKPGAAQGVANFLGDAMTLAPTPILKGTGRGLTIAEDVTDRLAERLKTSPLPRLTKELIKNKQYHELGALYALVGGAEMAPIISRTPGLKKIYKDLAYKSAAATGGAPSLDLKGLVNLKKHASVNEAYAYTGQFGEGQSRDLLKQYIYGNQPGFKKSSLVPEGLEKYQKRYGDMDVFEMESKIGHGNEISADSYGIRSLMAEKGIDFKNVQGKSKRFGLHESDNPIDPIDNVAGHVGWIDNTSGTPHLISQDIWKFTPEDYNVKWSPLFGNGTQPLNRTALTLDEYVTTKQSKLMDNAGKPFITMSSNPITNIPDPEYIQIHKDALASASGKYKKALDDLGYTGFDKPDLDLKSDLFSSPEYFESLKGLKEYTKPPISISGYLDSRKPPTPATQKRAKGGVVSKMGYRDDSPFRNRKSIDIHSPNGLIDMSHTSIPLIANGRYLPANSGMHKFNSKVITETPANDEWELVSETPADEWELI